MKIEMSVFDRKPLLLIKNSMYVGHHRSGRACVSLLTGRFLTRWGEVCLRSGTNNELLDLADLLVLTKSEIQALVSIQPT